MNKKKIIQLVVIIIAFGGSGLVLYNGFGKSTPTPSMNLAAGVPGTVPGGLPGSLATVPATGLSASALSDQDILPNGGKLDFDILKKQNLQSAQLDYPKLNVGKDIGIPENNIITPTPPGQ